MLYGLALLFGGIGAVFDYRALRARGADAYAMEERHRLRVIALKFYRTGFAVLLGLIVGQRLLLG